jgi:ubiquinone/menaquinone biosynthesis methyltransferase
VPDIYDSGYVEKLFDEMAGTYEAVNYITSFGFSKRWRRQFAQKASLRPGMLVCDLMCGMGECWEPMSARLSPGGRIVGVDLSSGMLNGATRRLRAYPGVAIQASRQNALFSALPDACADSVISGFGLKTFSPAQLETFAREVCRILKPGGTFSFIEVSVPQGWLFRDLYLFYLKNVIPVLGQLLLGNPENYRMLGVYSEKFGNCEAMREILCRNGLRAESHSYFFGCATGVSGIKS